MDRVAIKVTVDGAMRRICQDPKAEDFGYQKLLSLAGVEEDNNVKVFYFDDESDKVYVSCDADVAEAVRAQSLNALPASKYFTIHVVTKAESSSRPFRHRRHCRRGPCGQRKEFDFDSTWEKLLNLLRMFAPVFPGARCVLESPKLEELKTSKEVKNLLKLVEGDLKGGVHPFVVLHKVKGSNELANLLRLLKTELPDLAGFADEANENAETVHHGVVCDGCNQSPIRGLRFKCKDCDDFDLCSGCRFENKHDEAHSFDTIQTPTFSFPGFGAGFPGPFECFPRRKTPRCEKTKDSDSVGGTVSATKEAHAEPKDVAKVSNPWSEKEAVHGQTERSTDDEYEVVSDGKDAPKVEQDAAKATEDARYEREMKILEEMGFTNRENVLNLLQSMDGNLRNVLQALFSIDK